jgi:hypothetical protein
MEKIMIDFKNEAKRLFDSGLTVIPTKDKIPTIKAWGEYRHNKQTKEQLEQMPFTGDLAVLGGGGIFCIDLDTKYDFSGIANKFMSMLNDNLKESLNKLYYEQTPSGGYHLIGRCETRVGNQKLCVDKDQKEACIETKGDGGYFVVAPSKGYKKLFGDLANLEPITPDDLDTILNTARILTQKKPEEHKVSVKVQGVTPLDDYDSKHDSQDIIDMLLNHGWQVDRKKGEVTYLKRPGKQKGFSASVNKIPERLWVFSSNTDFNQEKTYSPSAVLATLEYSGNFSACAKDLFKQGYGVKDEIKTETIKPQTVNLSPAKLSGLAKKIMDFSKGNYDKGVQTGWKALMNMYRVSDHQLNIVTGIPSHGKSTWVDALSINLAVENGWRFCVYSPESYPLEIHCLNLIEKLIRKPITSATEKEVLDAVAFIEKHYVFVDCSKDDITLDQILTLASESKVNGLIIDPWNEMDSERPSGMSETDYIGRCLKKIRVFARNNKIATWIVAHPQKLYKNDKGEYNRPTLYDISGSAHWYNKADNGIVVHKGENNKVFVDIYKMKVKFYGKKGEVELLFNTDYHGYDDLIQNGEESRWHDERMK